MSEAPCAANGFLADRIALLNDSHMQLMGRPLIAGEASPETVAKAVFEAPFVVLSSGTETDPLFNYANLTALELFELDWASLIALPARKSAEADHQNTRAALMRRVQDNGFIENYSGVRISAGGRRFTIERATVWNVVDAGGHLHGQAATFDDWTYL